MKARRKKKQYDNDLVPLTQAKFLPDARSMDSPSSRLETVPSISQEEQGKEKGFNFGEVPIFAAGSGVAASPLQRKFTVSLARDKQEGKLEPIQRQEGEDEEPIQGKLEPVQRQEGEDEEPAQTKGASIQKVKAIQPQINLAPSESGKAMPELVQQKMETAFGTDFSGVRIHEGPQAKAINAIAYTQGENIHFQPGKYQPDTQSGQELLGHELTHVVQQKAGRVTVPQGKGTPINADPGLESEADLLGSKAARGERLEVTDASSSFQHKQLFAHESTYAVKQSSIPILQRKLTPEQIKDANRIRKARGLSLLPVEAAKQLNSVEEAIAPAPAANQPATNQKLPQKPQSDAKQSDSNFQVFQDSSRIQATLKQLKSWDKVKEQFASDEKTMWQFFNFRQGYVDYLISVLRNMYPGLIAKSVGSQDPTSDYDITISTPGSGQDVEAIKWFNAQVRKEFGVEPGTVFDTNLYAKDYLKVEENIDAAAKAEQKPDRDLDQPRNNFSKIGSLSQDVAALVKQRRYMKQVEWDRYVEKVVNNIKDPQQQKLIRHQYEEADSIYQVAAYKLLGEVKKDKDMTSQDQANIQQHTKLGEAEEKVLSEVKNVKLRDELRKQLLGAEELKVITHHNSDLVLKKSNELYLERMAKVRQIQETIRKLGTGEPTKVEALKAQVQQILGVACFYAAEAYHSEGAVKHIVAGVQGAKDPSKKKEIVESLKAEHFLQSFNEQLGDFLKDLSHYEGAPNGKIFYRSSKYLYRLFLAVEELRQYKIKNLPMLAIEATKSAGKLAEDIDKQLVAIRKGKVNFKNETEKNQASVNATMAILGVDTASKLKEKVLKMAEEFNVKARSYSKIKNELMAPSGNTSKSYFKNLQ